MELNTNEQITGLMKVTFKHNLLINGVVRYFNDSDFMDGVYFEAWAGKDVIYLLKQTYGYHKLYKCSNIAQFMRYLKGRFDL